MANNNNTELNEVKKQLELSERLNYVLWEINELRLDNEGLIEHNQALIEDNQDLQDEMEVLRKRNISQGEHLSLVLGFCRKYQNELSELKNDAGSEEGSEDEESSEDEDSSEDEEGYHTATEGGLSYEQRLEEAKEFVRNGGKINST